MKIQTIKLQLASFMQIKYTKLNDFRNKFDKIFFLTKSENDILLRKELEDLKHTNKLNIWFTVSHSIEPSEF